MSLIGTFQNSGPRATTSTRAISTNRLATARWCLRKRRQASAASELDRLRLPTTSTPAAAGGSAESDAGVEPTIEDVRDQVEQDDEAGEHEGHAHDHRGVVGEDRRDQQRADA